MKESFGEKPKLSTEEAVNVLPFNKEKQTRNYNIEAAGIGLAVALASVPDGAEAKDFYPAPIKGSHIEVKVAPEAQAQGLVFEVIKIEETFGDGRDRHRMRVLVQTRVDSYLAKFAGNRQSAMKVLKDQVEKIAKENPIFLQITAFQILRTMAGVSSAGETSNSPYNAPTTTKPQSSAQPSEIRKNRTDW